MNAKHGKPEGTSGTITFDASAYREARTEPAVRDADGNYWTPAMNPNLWLPTNVRDDQFTAA
jgi:hypothetical protein